MFALDKSQLWQFDNFLQIPKGIELLQVYLLMALPEGILLSSNAFKVGQKRAEKPLNIKTIC